MGSDYETGIDDSKIVEGGVLHHQRAKYCEVNI